MSLGPAWGDIRRHHPQLKECKFELAWGYHSFWASTHLPGREGAEYNIRDAPYSVGGWLIWDALTVQVSPSCLQRGPAVTFETLMHEAVHVLGWARHQERSGHGELFATMAAEMGLTVIRPEFPEPTRPEVARARIAGVRETDAEVGARIHAAWLAAREHEVSLNDALRRKYATTICELTAALAPHQTALAEWLPACPDVVAATRWAVTASRYARSAAGRSANTTEVPPMTSQAMNDGNGRTGHERCGGRTRLGTPCRLPAGHGTSHPGIGCCDHHGGATPTHEEHARRVLAERAEQVAVAELARLNIPPVTDPLEAIAELAGGKRSRGRPGLPRRWTS